MRELPSIEQLFFEGRIKGIMKKLTHISKKLNIQEKIFDKNKEQLLYK